MNLRIGSGRSRMGFKATTWILFVTISVLLSIGSPYPGVMLLHHSATLLIAVFLLYVISFRELSNISFALIAFYALFHVVGARWTYIDVPYDKWTEYLFGINLSECFGWQRNQYDRIVHFVFGLLLLYPVSEIANKWFAYKSSHSRYLAWEFIAMSSLVYELFEWLLTFFVPVNQVAEYNGQQGDMWDAQKDMALAVAGATISWLLFLAIRWLGIDKTRFIRNLFSMNYKKNEIK